MINNLCSRKSLALLAFLTGLVVAASFAIRSVLLGRLTLLVVRVLDMLPCHVPPLLVNGVALPVVLPGISELSALTE